MPPAPSQNSDSSDGASDGADGADETVAPDTAGRDGVDAFAAAAAQTPEAGRERTYGNPDMDNRGPATVGTPLQVAKAEAFVPRKDEAGEAQEGGAEARKASVHAGLRAAELTGSRPPSASGPDIVLAKDVAMVDRQVIWQCPPKLLKWFA